MESHELFSHRAEPEVVYDAGRSSEAVQLPTFSDRPKNGAAATTPQS